MITPRFSCCQDEQWVRIMITTPYVKFQEAEFEIQGDTFYFYCKPYLLRLHFSSQLADDGSAVGQFDIEKGEFTVKLPKLVDGEVFDDLNMITKLLTPRKTNDRNVANLIEVLQDPTSKISGDSGELNGSEMDWFYPQNIPSEFEAFKTDSYYGFLNTKSGLFTVKIEEGIELLSLRDPDHTPLKERLQLKEEAENSRFNTLHFIGNMIDGDDELKLYMLTSGLMHLRLQALRDQGDLEGLEKSLRFTTEEIDEMTNLPRKEYLTDPTQERSLYLGLVDLLFAFNYHYRFESGHDDVDSFCFGPEAPCSITKLSPTLSWLLDHQDLSSTIRSLLRRALTQPYFRNWVLCMQVINDVVTVFKLGKQLVLKYLLWIRRIFNTVEPYYVMNDLYITDYCVWIQTCHQSHLDSLASALASFEISPDLVGLGVAETLQKTQDGTLADLLSNSDDGESCDYSVSSPTRLKSTGSDIDSDDSSIGEELDSDRPLLSAAQASPVDSVEVAGKAPCDGTDQLDDLSQKSEDTSLLYRMMSELNLVPEDEETTDERLINTTQTSKPLIEIIRDS